MCTTVGFSYKNGMTFGRTLEIGIVLDNKVIFVPKDKEDFIDAKECKFPSKYSVLGTAFFDVSSFGDGINEMGLMASSNLLPKYATFSEEIVKGKINMTTSNAFDYLLSRCKDVEEVRKEADNIIVIENENNEGGMTTSMHFFFMDAKGEKVVLEPRDGVLVAYDNPYGVLTNSPDFGWHETNLKNYINLRSENIEEGNFNGKTILKFGEGTGMLGLPGDFTPPSRFVKAAYFVSNTPKNLDRESAILQTFRILSQSDIPTGSITGDDGKTQDQTLYTAVMDTKEQAYFIKCHDNINIQSFYLKDYKDETDIKFIDLKKEMSI